MYYKLPVKERIELMKSYKKANPDMSYQDMVNDYNTSYEKFDNGGKKDNTNVIINNGLPVKSLDLLKQEQLKEVANKNKRNDYLNSLRTQLDSIQNQALKTSNVFDQIAMRKQAGSIYQTLLKEKPELVKNELSTGEKAGKTIIASSKYLFPSISPLTNAVEGSIAAFEFIQNPNTHNTAGLMTEVAPLINNKYSTAYQLMGDYLTGQEVGLFPKDKR